MIYRVRVVYLGGGESIHVTENLTDSPDSVTQMLEDLLQTERDHWNTVAVELTWLPNEQSSTRWAVDIERERTLKDGFRTARYNVRSVTRTCGTTDTN